MNYEELQEAILTDAKRADLATEVARYIREGEERIFERLEAYPLQYTFTDTDRDNTDTGVYDHPSKIISISSIAAPECEPLVRGDETLVARYRNMTGASYYVPRPNTIVIAGTPAPDSTFLMLYFGLPEYLSNSAPTNTLLDDNGKLYKQAALVSLYQRTKDYESATVCLQEMTGSINEINRRVKKMIGGRQSAPPVNTQFRSSY